MYINILSLAYCCSQTPYCISVFSLKSFIALDSSPGAKIPEVSHVSIFCSLWIYMYHVILCFTVIYQVMLFFTIQHWGWDWK